MREQLIEGYPDARVQFQIVWSQILRGDDHEHAKRQAATFTDTRVVSYWDPDERVGKALMASIPVGDNPFAWDVYEFFDGEAEWGTPPPAPLAWAHQLGGGDKEHFAGGEISERLASLARSILGAVEDEEAPQATPLASSLVDLFVTLTDEQRARCCRAYDDENRDAEVFLPGERPGLRIGELSSSQIDALRTSIGLFLSADGYEKAMRVAAQSHGQAGLLGYHLNFFGDPTTPASPWAFRVSEHHLTLVHVDSDDDRFGPILLGANPPDVWDAQEDAALACFSALSEDDRKLCVLPGAATSGEPLGNRGARIGDLSAPARALAARMVDARLALFAESQQEKLRRSIDALGGAVELRLAFFGAMKRRSRDGGRADWKIEGGGFLCDYESSRGHTHLTLRARP